MKKKWESCNDRAICYILKWLTEMICNYWCYDVMILMIEQAIMYWYDDMYMNINDKCYNEEYNNDGNAIMMMTRRM